VGLSVRQRGQGQTVPLSLVLRTFGEGVAEKLPNKLSGWQFSAYKIIDLKTAGHPLKHLIRNGVPDTSIIVMRPCNSMGIDIAFIVQINESYALVCIQCKNGQYSIHETMMTLHPGLQYADNRTRKLLEKYDGTKSSLHPAAEGFMEYAGLWHKYTSENSVCAALFDNWIRIAFVAKTVHPRLQAFSNTLTDNVTNESDAVKVTRDFGDFGVLTASWTPQEFRSAARSPVVWVSLRPQVRPMPGGTIALDVSAAFPDEILSKLPVFSSSVRKALVHTTLNTGSRLDAAASKSWKPISIRRAKSFYDGMLEEEASARTTLPLSAERVSAPLGTEEVSAQVSSDKDPRELQRAGSETKKGSAQTRGKRSRPLESESSPPEPEEVTAQPRFDKRRRGSTDVASRQ
jgi:hypothetical protein